MKFKASVQSFLLQSLFPSPTYAFQLHHQGFNVPTATSTFGPNARLGHNIASSSTSLNVSNEVEEEEDWRSFRAKLVSKEQKLRKSDQQVEVLHSDQFIMDEYNSGTEKKESWIYDSGLNVETGTVLLNHPSSDSDGCRYGLNRQYLHKSVVLILEHDSIAQEGRTTGLLLNRPTDLILYENIQGEEDTDPITAGWNIWFGGEEFGIHTDHPKFFCLHSMNTPEAKEMSREVMPGIYFCSVQNAKELVADGFARTSDFWVFSGFQTWGHGELMEDMKEGVWHAVSTDAHLVRKGLRILNAGARCDGDRTWKILMRLIGQHVKDCQGGFCDRMLSAWSKQKLEFDGPPKFAQEEEDEYWSSSTHTNVIKPGMMIRASTKESPYLLSNQQFHRSTILILQDEEDMTVGVIINMPSEFPVELSIDHKWSCFDDEMAVVLPLRYGGPVGGPCYEEYCEGDPLFSLHMSPALREAKIGEPIGDDEQGVWRCSFEDVADAIRGGKAFVEEFIVGNGICVWNKEEDEDGNIGKLTEQHG